MTPSPREQRTFEGNARVPNEPTALNYAEQSTMGRLIYSVLLGTAQPEMPEAISFRVAEGTNAALVLFPLLLRRFGLPGAIKAAFKVGTRTRVYYALIRGHEIISDGWIRHGRTSSYRIARSDCVIGPIWTRPDQRGKGYATLGLRLALAFCSKRIFVDTWIGNLASRACIEAAGFELCGTSNAGWSHREIRLIMNQLNHRS